MAEPIRVHPMRRMPRTGVELATQRMDPHPIHPRRHATSANRTAFTGEDRTQPACAGQRIVQMDLGDPTHQRPILCRSGFGWSYAVECEDAERLALPKHRPCVGSVDHHFALSNPALVSALLNNHAPG